MGERACRVAVDVLAVDRLFDYLVPDSLAEALGVGTIVRVGLAGRRVRGWVVADDVVPDAPPERLKPILEVVSAGPPADVVDLTAWVAWRWAGPRLAVLRAASPAAIVHPRTPSPTRRPGADPAPPARPDPDAATLAASAEGPLSVLRWPPAADRAAVVAALLPDSGSTLVVTPGTGSAAIARRLAAVSGREVVAYLSDGRPRDRAQAWLWARGGDCVVVGGRTTVFAPVPDLALVVVLDDGAEAHKEERSPTWHSRDVALERARRAGARVVLVSPAPPVEALALAPASVPSRSAERAGWPILEVVDRRGEPPGFGMFSPRLVEVVRSAVADGGRAVCVLNRRGRARLLACARCDEIARCERCSAAVAEAGDGLTCPACGLARPRLCAACGAEKLKILRAGVTRLREELAALVPGVDVASVDASGQELPTAPVVIGTEAVLHRVRRARTVAFLEFDQELLAPRFRAGEQALWLLVRAARLVGQRADGGRMLVQTRLPRHDVIRAALGADPGLLAAADAPRRAMLRLPPYSALARLTGDAAGLAEARAALLAAGQDPVDDGAALLLRAADHDVLAHAVSVALAAGRSLGRIRAEVDPARL